jgi:hypothetical protein
MLPPVRVDYPQESFLPGRCRGHVCASLSLDVCGVFAEKKGSTVPMVVVMASALIIVVVLLATVVAFKSIPEITSSAASGTREQPQESAHTTPLP